MRPFYSFLLLLTLSFPTSSYASTEGEQCSSSAIDKEMVNNQRCTVTQNKISTSSAFTSIEVGYEKNHRNAKSEAVTLALKLTDPNRNTWKPQYSIGVKFAAIKSQQLFDEVEH